MHQLVNKNVDSIKMHGTTVKKTVLENWIRNRITKLRRRI